MVVVLEGVVVVVLERCRSSGGDRGCGGDVRGEW